MQETAGYDGCCGLQSSGGCEVTGLENENLMNCNSVVLGEGKGQEAGSRG